VKQRMAMVLLACAGWAGSAGADHLPDVAPGSLAVRLHDVATGMNGVEAGVLQYAPVDFDAPKDGSGRRFIVTLGGLVRIIDAEGNLLPTPFLDTTHANTSIDPGLYGFFSMKFHPGFADPGSAGYGKFYTITHEVFGAGTADFSASNRIVANTALRPQSVIKEWTVDDIHADVFAGTSRDVLRIQQPGRNHNVDHLAFDNAGLLYISSGDGDNVSSTTSLTNSDNGPDLGVVFGKVLRIDPFGTNGASGNYGIPDNNPFANDGDHNTLAEIYTYGHRNPWRLGYDPVTDTMYEGDVGQTQIEEVNVLTPGGNYGWNLKEGSFLYDKSNQAAVTPDTDANDNGIGDVAEANNLIDPLFEYDHTEGRSVTGGFVYRGTYLPHLYGKYVFGDYNGRSNANGGGGARLFYGDVDTGEFYEMLLDPTGDELAALIYSFGVDADGELYILGGTDGIGSVTLLLPRLLLGDANNDGVVDELDFLAVEQHLGTLGAAHGALLGDANDDGRVDGDDWLTVERYFGATLPPLPVPEPGMAGLGLLLLVLGRRWHPHPN